jgi:cystathionine beta-lyase
MSEKRDDVPAVQPVTALIQHPYVPPAGFDAVPPAVHKASTVFFPDVAALRSRTWLDKSGYTYGLHGTPTTFTLEARLATLEGGSHVVLTPSGLAAIVLVDTTFLSAGDHLLLPDNVYNPSREFARHELARWGVTHGFYNPLDPQSLADALTPATKLVWLEAPGSVTLEFPDLRALVRLLRERAPAGTVIALDNTWGAGLALRPFDLGEGLAVDVSMQALTKYASGGADVLMGAVVVRDQPLYERLAWTHSRSGLGVGADDVETVLRSLPTLPLRYAAHDAACRRVAQWCAGRSEFARVLHPALPGSPGHEHWLSHCRAAGGLVTVELQARYSQREADAFVDALRRFRLGYSWGGPMSLAVPYRPPGAARPASPYRGALVRFSIGLEAVEDLLADLAQALDVLPS